MKIPEWFDVKDQYSKLGRHSWAVSRLIELSKDLEVMEIPIDHMHVYNRYSSLTLREMVMHMKATQAADLTKPIILDEDGEIMDGRHRLMKVMLIGLPSIKAVRFPENPSPCKTEE